MPKYTATPAVTALRISLSTYASMRDELLEELKEIRERGERGGKFLYMPFLLVNGVHVPSGSMMAFGRGVDLIELVGTFTLKSYRIGGKRIEKGDTTFCLRSEWNEQDNPLD